MPELPEVENVKRSLEKLIKPQDPVSHAELRRADIRFKVPKDLVRKLVGLPIIKIHRRAKYLLFETDRGFLLNHLGMTGTWRLREKGESLEIHDHFTFKLASGIEFIFRDPRRFGMLDFIDIGNQKSHVRLRDLGPEPLENDFNAAYLFAKSRKRVLPIKNFIMNQKIVVGVGNIYASEALFQAKIRPQRKAAKLTRRETDALVTSIKNILTTAIALGGSSIRDFKNSEGVYGAFQDQFMVYDREGLACRVCGTRLKSQVIGGRSSFWCPSCQK